MKQKVISFHYTVKDSEGKTIDSSSGGEPMTFLEGASQIIPGLEKAVLHMKTGDKKTVDVVAAEAYGEYDKELCFEVARTQFPKDEKIDIGMQFRAGGGEEGPSPIFTVTGSNATHVSVDGNHPLAGKNLRFDVEVTEVREATADELEHGHAHGPNGHGHGDGGHYH